MSLQKAAQALSAQGRYGDSTLVHMQPREVAGLQALAKKHGRSLTVNPQTGLPEAFDLGDIVEGLAPVALGFALGPAGLGLSNMGAALATGAVSTLATGDLGKGLAAGFGAYSGATLGGATAAAGQQAISQTARDEALKQTAEESVISGIQEKALQDATTGEVLKAGAQSFIEDPNRLVQGLGGPVGALTTGYGVVAPVLGAMQPKTEMPEIPESNYSIYQRPLTREYLNPEQDPYSSKELTYFRDAYGPARLVSSNKAGGGIVALANGGPTPSTPGYITTQQRISPEEFISSYLTPVKTTTSMPTIPGVKTPQTSLPPPSAPPVVDAMVWKIDENGKPYRLAYDSASGTFKRVYKNPMDAPEKTVDTLAEAATKPLTYEGGEGIGASAPATQAPAPVTTIDPMTGQVTGFDPGLGPNAVGSLGAPSTSSDDPTGPESENDGVVGGVADGGGGVGPGSDGDDGGVSGAADAGIGGGGEKEGGLIRLARGGLAKDSFVVPADVVSAMGNGSSSAGLSALNKALGRYAAGGATMIRGAGDGLSDSIPTHIEGKQPARVANEEAYITPQQVKRIGGGSVDKGANKLYAMMDRVRKQAHGKTTQQRPVNARKALT